MNDEKSAGSDEPRRGFKIEIDPQIDDSLQGGLNALGQVFSGFVGAIKDAVGPELIRNAEVANWLTQLASCLEEISRSLSANGEVPAEATGRLTFFVEQFDTALEDSRLAAQKASLREHLDRAHEAAQGAVSNPEEAATNIGKAAGYFKAAAASCLPMSHGADKRPDEQVR